MANHGTVSHVIKDDKSRLDRPPYKKQENFKASYSGHCFCGAVQFEISGEPKANCFCHCRSCQRLHGAPATLTSIFEKSQVHFTKGAEEDLVFYSPQEKVTEYKLPLKISCKQCHSPIGNEGNNMILIAPALIEFENETGDSKDGGRLPEAFKPDFHQYYGTRIRDIEDDLPKFGAEQGKDPLNKAAEEMCRKQEREKEHKEAQSKTREDLKERKPDEGEETNTSDKQGKQKKQRTQ
ncbi:hypothetical protein PYCC9005_002588 [Savitreella phatthalungensis]